MPTASDLTNPDLLYQCTISERDFQKQVIEYASALGYVVYHHDTTMPTRYVDDQGRQKRARRMVGAGFPDLVLVHPKKQRVV